MKLRCLILALAVMGLAAGPAFAQQQGGAMDQSQGAGGPAVSGGEQPEMKEVQGEISDINPDKKTIEVGGGIFGGTTLQVTSNTKFVSAAGVKPGLSLSSLKKGDRVRASYLKSGDRNVAEEIVVLSPSAGKAAPGAAPRGGTTGPEGSSPQP
ncbi:MAG: hypothetical protein V2A77_03095 [Pseudomonadota bacterium]